MKNLILSIKISYLTCKVGNNNFITKKKKETVIPLAQSHTLFQPKQSTNNKKIYKQNICLEGQYLSLTLILLLL